MSLVSIIITYYNRPEKLQRALDSVFNQTYKNFEVFIIDDCSQIKPNALKSEKIQYIRNTENKGPGYSRQVGLNKARGRYVCFLDSDDSWNPKFLEKCISEINCQKIDIAFAYVKTLYIQDGHIIELPKKGFTKENKILPTILIKGRIWHTSSCVWNKNVLDRCENWIQTRNWEDYAFDINAATINNNILAIDEPLMYYDISGDDKLSKQKEALIQVEKSKSICYISRVLKKSKYGNNTLIKNLVATLLVNNTISLLGLNIPVSSSFNDNLKSLNDWKSAVFIFVFKLIQFFPIKTRLSVLRKIRDKMRSKQLEDIKLYKRNHNLEYFITPRD